MSNALYTKGKQALLDGVDLSADTIKIALVTNAYTPNLGTDQYFDPAISGKTVGSDQAVGGKTVTDGVFNFSTVTWTAVAGGSTVSYFVLYKDTGTPTTSPLIACIDSTTGAALPITTNGGDITFTPDSGANKFLKLT